MAVAISNTDLNADWIKWRTRDYGLGSPSERASKKQDFLGVVRGEEPEEPKVPFAEVVKKYKRRGRGR